MKSNKQIIHIGFKTGIPRNRVSTLFLVLREVLLSISRSECLREVMEATKSYDFTFTIKGDKHTFHMEVDETGGSLAIYATADQSIGVSVIQRGGTRVLTLNKDNPLELSPTKILAFFEDNPKGGEEILTHVFFIQQSGDVDSATFSSFVN